MSFDSREKYSGGPNNSVVLSKRVHILFTFYRWKCMILGKSQILLGEKMHVDGIIFWE